MKPMLGLLALVFVVACGAVPRPLPGNAHPTPPTGALVAWQNFPDDQTPRPIVAFWNVFGSAAGFTGDSEKVGGLCGKLTVATTLPAHPPREGVSALPAGAPVTYSSISA